jgi:hypothetical protein
MAEAHRAVGGPGTSPAALMVGGGVGVGLEGVDLVIALVVGVVGAVIAAPGLVAACAIHALRGGRTCPGWGMTGLAC